MNPERDPTPSRRAAAPRAVGILGASGYTGFELLRILRRHPGVRVAALNSRSCPGRPVRDLYPDWTGPEKFTGYSLPELRAMNLDVLFAAAGEDYAKEPLPTVDARIIDLGHGLRHVERVAYGLPELFREKIRGATTVANPGCYATAAILAAWPIVQARLAETLIFDGKSGWSGAGRAPAYVNDPAHREENVIAYRITRHRHRGEIERALGHNVSFTPHVVPVFRGILVTAHVLLTRRLDGKDLRALYAEAYAGEPFVRVLDRVPELHDAQDTNLCCIGGFEIDENGRAVIIATIDNLLKGASGQAVQNMNLMLGLPETAGLQGKISEDP